MISSQPGKALRVSASFGEDSYKAKVLEQYQTRVVHNGAGGLGNAMTVL
jgi:hypothetical protein